MIDVSIIIPVYNVEKYLVQCIESVLKQTFQNKEIILVNDGSTDGSLDICKKYEKLENVTLVNKKNGGLSSARNSGLKVANGKYILFLDSDDFYEDSLFLEKIMNKVSLDTDLVLFPIKKYYSENDHSIIPIVGEYEEKNYTEIVCELMNTNSYKSSACSKLILKKTIIDNDILFYDNIHSEDIEWSLNILIHSKNISIIRDVYYVYRQQREGSITSSFSLKAFNDYLGIIDRSIHIIESNNTNKSEFYAYLAYQYAILLGYSSSLLKLEQIKIDDLLQYKYLLKYGKDRKTRLVYFLCSIIGVNLTIKILGMFISSKKKRGK